MKQIIHHQLNCCPFCGNIGVKVVTCTTMTGPDGVTPVEVQPYQRIECPECGIAVSLPAHKSRTGKQVACVTQVACEVYEPASAVQDEDVVVDDELIVAWDRRTETSKNLRECPICGKHEVSICSTNRHGLDKVYFWKCHNDDCGCEGEDQSSYYEAVKAWEEDWSASPLQDEGRYIFHYAIWD